MAWYKIYVGARSRQRLGKLIIFLPSHKNFVEAGFMKMSIQQTGSKFRLQSIIQKVEIKGKRSHPDAEPDTRPTKRKKENDSIVFVTLEQIPDLMTGDELVRELAKNLKHNGLSFMNPFCSWHQISPGRFRMNMRSKRQAELLCWFNGLVLKNGPKSSSVKCERGGDWKGPPPQYKSYDEFILHEGKPMDLSYKPKIQEAVVPKSTPENGRNEPLWAETNPTVALNGQRKEQFPVSLKRYPQSKSVADTVAFLNQVMKDEGLIDKHTPKAILSYRCEFPSGYCFLEMANPEVQKKICWLNGIPWSTFGIIIIGHDWSGSIKPQYNSWAIYKAQGDANRVQVFLRNPPTKAKNEILDFLNAKLWEYGLARRDEFGVLRFNYLGPGSNLVGGLEVASPEMREKLLYLNGIGGWKDPAYRFILFPHVHYKGPPPKYRNFSDFLKGFEIQNPSLSESSHQFESSEHDDIRNPSSGGQVEAQGSHCSKSNRRGVSASYYGPCVGLPMSEESNRLFAAPSGQNENSSRSLDPQIAASPTYRTEHPVPTFENNGDMNQQLLASNSNYQLASQKDETEQLRKQVADLQKSNEHLKKSLSDKTQAANYFQSLLSKVKEELETAKGQLGDVHQSWQEQAQVIVDKDAQLAESQGRIDELKECAAKREKALAAQSQALLNETMNRQKAEGMLGLLQMENMKQQARILAALSALNPPDSKKEGD
mmetsp:Transcript_34415/g.83554  ORF Transcript_34415/g.83554 Transcript_34415/m.83554 type:complete len:712 (+) Transcript_34415:1424-3559(+)